MHDKTLSMSNFNKIYSIFTKNAWNSSIEGVDLNSDVRCLYNVRADIL